MIESPLIKELEVEFTSKAIHQSILIVIEARFGTVPEDIRMAVQHIQDESVLRAMTSLAARCPDVDVFRRALSSADSKPR